MEYFLQECRPNLKNANDSTKIQVVLGNEACDLDSTVSALVYAFFLSKLHNSLDVVVPVLNVKREDLLIHTEVVFFLEETSIPIDNMICIDDIDLKDLSKKENFSVVLVDHNALSPELSFLESKVTQIIDHHAVENPDKISNCKVKIEPVGSCASLIAEEVFHSREDILDPQIAMLLYGTILLDTVCLQESAKRVTNKDRAMVNKLESILENISREEVFEMLQHVKYDISKLTPKDLLRKDVKFISWNSTNTAVASLPVLLQDTVETEKFQNALNEYMSEKNLSCVVLIGSEMPDGINMRRQIGIFDKCPESLKKTSDYLMSLDKPSLQLQPLSSPMKSLALFEQRNIALTRKFVLPAMQTYIKCILPGKHELIENDTKGHFSDNQKSVVNGYGIPHYKAETLDFPESPKHSSFLGVTVQLQELKLDGELVQESPSADDELDLSKDMESSNEEKCGTLRKIRYYPTQSEMLNFSNDRDLDQFSPVDDIIMPDEVDAMKENQKFDYIDQSSAEKSGTLKKIPLYSMKSETEDDQRSLSSLSNKSDLDIFSPMDDIILPDDVDTLEEMENSDYLESTGSDPIPEMSAAEEFEEERSWKSCIVNGEERKIDMKVIEPYRKVLSHGGYQGSNHNAIIIFSACYLPDRCRKDYEYVMDNLFLYVITTLDELVAEDYVLVYLHGATERSKMPSFGWLKRCYQMIDRRLRKNLKGLYLVHPTFWLKTIVIMTKPFISSKFSRKLKFVYSLKELSSIIPLDHVSIPDKVKQFDQDLYPDS